MSKTWEKPKAILIVQKAAGSRLNNSICFPQAWKALSKDNGVRVDRIAALETLRPVIIATLAAHH